MGKAAAVKRGSCTALLAERGKACSGSRAPLDLGAQSTALRAAWRLTERVLRLRLAAG